MASITRISDSGDQAGNVELVNLVQFSTGRIITPVRVASTNRLKLISWQLDRDGTLTRLGDSGDQAGEVSLCSSVAVGNNRLVTAVRGVQSGRVKLISWQVSDDATSIQRIADSGTQAGAVDRLDLHRWNASDTSQPPISLITTVRSANSQRLKLIGWRLFGNGGFTRLGDSGQQVGQVSHIAAHPGTDHDFFATAVRGINSQRLKLIGWRVSVTNTDMSFDRLGDSGDDAGDVSLLDLEGVNLFAFPGSSKDFVNLITAVRGKQSQRLKLIGWLADQQEGQLTRQADSGQLAGAVDLLSLAVRPWIGAVTAVRSHNTGRLKLIWWGLGGNHAGLPGGELEISRVADSGQQAGEVDLLTILPLDIGGANRPTLTAVKGKNSGRLKLILWHLQ